MIPKKEIYNFFTQNNNLTFGDFTLKSGKKSPYFFNTGALCSGYQLATMGKMYADMLQEVEEFKNATVIFGSAYKGIPLSVATAIALNGTEYSHLRAVSDRKEIKTHGDVSGFLGRLITGDKAVIVDDVISNGETKIEAIEKLRDNSCEALGIIIAFDRCEPIDTNGTTAKEALEQRTGIKVYPLLTAFDIINEDEKLGYEIKKHLDNFQV